MCVCVFAKQIWKFVELKANLCQFKHNYYTHKPTYISSMYICMYNIYVCACVYYLALALALTESAFTHTLIHRLVKFNFCCNHEAHQLCRQLFEVCIQAALECAYQHFTRCCEKAWQRVNITNLYVYMFVLIHLYTLATLQHKVTLLGLQPTANCFNR